MFRVVLQHVDTVLGAAFGRYKRTILHVNIMLASLTVGVVAMTLLTPNAQVTPGTAEEAQRLRQMVDDVKRKSTEEKLEDGVHAMRHFMIPQSEQQEQQQQQQQQLADRNSDRSWYFFIDYNQSSNPKSVERKSVSLFVAIQKEAVRMWIWPPLPK